jgi:hypothetical protein
MPGTVVGNMRIEYHRNKDPNERRVEFFAINPGKKNSEWRSQKIFGKSEVEKIIADINDEKAFAAIVQDPFQAFIAKQDFDRLTIWLRASGSSTSDDAAMLVVQTRDATVETATLIDKGLLKTITSALKHGIDGVEAGKAQFVVVTLPNPLKALS